MARIRDVPCSGGCGKLIWRGNGCLPPGQSMCQPCRRARWQVPRDCAQCSKPLPAKKRVGRFCSRKCSNLNTTLNRVGPHLCPSCGTGVPDGPAVKCCPPCRAMNLRVNYRKKNTARRGVCPQGTMTIRELLARDGWRCHLCRKLIPRNVHYLDPLAPTFDHLIPVADGGSDEPENLAAAHRSCNSRRGTGGTVQLLLVG